MYVCMYGCVLCGGCEEGERLVTCTTYVRTSIAIVFVCMYVCMYILGGGGGGGGSGEGVFF